MFNVTFNYKSDKQYAKELWKCDSCQTSIESQNHVLWCPAYAELRIGKDIKSDLDLIQYMKQVLMIREKLKLTK